MAKLNTRAAISWTVSTATGTERVLLLDVPLRDVRPGYSQTAYTAESLDKTAISTITVGSGAHELVGTVRYEDDPQGLLDLVQAGATNTTLTYIPDLADPDQSYTVYLIAPRDLSALAVELDRQRGSAFGEAQIELRFRKTDQKAFTELYEGSAVLFSYRAGDSLAGATFSRADTATYSSKGYGTVTSAASGKARIHWMDTDADGIRETPTLLLEGTSTNLITSSENFGAWSTSGTPVLTSGQSDPAGGTAAYLIEDDDAAAAEYVYLVPTFTTDAVSKAVSVFVKAGTATTTTVQLRDSTAGADRLLANVTWSNGVPATTASTGTLIGTTRHRDGWYRLLFRTTAVTVANSNRLILYPAGSTAGNTGNTYFYGAQAENALNPTSYIPTSGSTDARTEDSLTFPFPARVQTMTMYVRFIQQGTLPWSSALSGVVGIGTASNGLRFEIRNTAGAATISCVGAANSGTITPGATHGQVVELVAWLRYSPATRTATTQVQAAVAGVIGTAGSVSASAAMSDDFGSDVLYLAALAGGTGPAPVPFTHVGVMRGVQDMLTMRRVMGV